VVIPRAMKIAFIAAAAVVVLATTLMGFAIGRAGSLSLGLASIKSKLGLLSASDSRLVSESIALRLRDPRKEASLNVKNGDFRLIAMSGFGVTIPGTPRSRDGRSYSAKYGIREVVGAADTGNQYTLQYQNEAHRFALAYNLVVLEAVHEETAE
jgi:hypothetical protein